jgi:hypothetical protein
MNVRFEALGAEQAAARGPVKSFACSKNSS